jgi:uroporphyrinogen-III synthase
MRVIVTRPQQDALKWVDALRHVGLDAVALPLIAVSSPPDEGAVRAAWLRLPRFDAVMFVSGNAVDHFFALKPPATNVFNAQAAIKTRAFVTGPGSYAALQRSGCEPRWIDAPDLVSGPFDSEALWSVVDSTVSRDFSVLIVRGTVGSNSGADAGHGRDWFAKKVQAAGGSVEFVVAYCRESPAMDAQEQALASEAAQDGAVWLFSSSEAIGNLVSRMPHVSWSRARAVATHARIAQAARDAGFGVVCESLPALEPLLASIESLQ